jgi:hypothetical protein
MNGAGGKTNKKEAKSRRAPSRTEGAAPGAQLGRNRFFGSRAENITVVSYRRYCEAPTSSTTTTLKRNGE